MYSAPSGWRNYGYFMQIKLTHPERGMIKRRNNLSGDQRAEWRLRSLIPMCKANIIVTMVTAMFVVAANANGISMYTYHTFTF